MARLGYKFTPAQLETMRVSHLGQVAWNRGKKQCNHDLTFYMRSKMGIPYCLICKRQNGAKYRAKNRKQINQKGRLARYNLPIAVFRELWANQKGCCAICGDLLDPVQYRIDHDHKTGQVRGILCVSCNTAIGLFKDSPKNLISAVRYLNGNRDKGIYCSSTQTSL